MIKGEKPESAAEQKCEFQSQEDLKCFFHSNVYYINVTGYLYIADILVTICYPNTKNSKQT